jgi:hypothetical protein
MQLLADFMLYEKTDLYAVRPIEDLSGQNAYRATIQRLDFFQQDRPDTETDIVLVTRAKCWARLGAYRNAIEDYMQVAAMGDDSPLSPLARERAENLLPFREVHLLGEKPKTMADFIQNLETRIERLREIEIEYLGTYDAILARRDREQQQVELCLGLFRNRFVLRHGAQRAIDLAENMLEEHATSARVEEHRLRLGLFYLEMARDMTTLSPPESPTFDLELYERLSRNAREHISKVALADGRLEKIEAQAQLRVLDALDQRVTRLNP